MNTQTTTAETSTVITNGKRYMVLPGHLDLASTREQMQGWWPVKHGDYATCDAFAKMQKVAKKVGA